MTRAWTIDVFVIYDSVTVRRGLYGGFGRINARPPVSSRMRLDHLAVWTGDLDRLRDFYERYFGALAGARYKSARQPGLTSYFLSFPDGEVRLELMALPAVGAASEQPALGHAHIALAVGSRDAVDRLTARLA